MTLPVFALGALTALLAGLLRAGGVSLVQTPRADAWHDAAEGDKGAERVARVLESRDLVVPSINIVHTALLVTAAVPMTWALTSELDGVVTLAGLVGLALALTLVADLVPRVIGRRGTSAIAYRLSRLLVLSVDIGSRAAEIMWHDDEDDDSSHEDEQDEEEVGLIASVLEFAETIVREVMVPRPDMITIGVDANLDELLSEIEEHGYSRIPVVGDGIDDVVGMVITKDLLPRLANGNHPTTVADVMRPIDHVPETKRVPELLRDMQESKSHMAVVVDEFGGTAGLVTIEDLLEELVGEIVDEYDEDELLVEELAEGRWKVDGRLAVDDLSELIDGELPDEEWDTVAGLVLGLAGRVPKEGERFSTDGVELVVQRVQGRRVQEVEVVRVPFDAPVVETR